MSTSWTEIASVDDLVALLGEPGDRARDKERAELGPLQREWLSGSPFCMMATADANGHCDVSPKGDPAGRLVHVLDDRTIALAERPGNRRVDGYRNVLANPRVGLDFVVPGRGDTLRINGRARLVVDAPFFDELIVKGHRPILALVVDIETVFFHCAKAFMRSKLWQPETWEHAGRLPTRAQIAKQAEDDRRNEFELDAYYGPSYADHLYG